MLGANVPTHASHSSSDVMKDTCQAVQRPSGTDQELSPLANGEPATSPVTVASETAAQQQSPTEPEQEATSTGAAPPPPPPRNWRNERDSSWLELEVCREHLRQACPRSAEECRYAHPEQRIYVKDGKVTCCYDFLKDRCYRERCRYFHPPIHIKEKLVSAGKQFGVMMSSLYVFPGGRGGRGGGGGGRAMSNAQFHSNSANSFPSLATAPVPLVGPVIYGPDGRIMSAAAPPGFIPGSLYGSGTERIDICPYFAQGKCNNLICPLLHPEPHVRLNLDSTVTVCRDFVRGGCSREKCRYFHPPLTQLDSGAMPALVQQGVVVASPVMPVYPPLVYPMAGAVTSLAGAITLPSPIGSALPLFPSVPAAVTLPVVLASPHPPLHPPPITITPPYLPSVTITPPYPPSVTITPPYSHSPISKIISTQHRSCLDRTSPPVMSVCSAPFQS